jgi:hypothetical protein
VYIKLRSYLLLTEVVFHAVCHLSPSDTVNLLYWRLEGI